MRERKRETMDAVWGADDKMALAMIRAVSMRVCMREREREREIVCERGT